MQRSGRERMSLARLHEGRNRAHLVAARLELSSDRGVADRDRQGLLGDVGRVGHHGAATAQQGAVCVAPTEGQYPVGPNWSGRRTRKLGERGIADFSIAGHLRVLHEHVLSRNADIRELDPAVVDAVPAKLLACGVGRYVRRARISGRSRRIATHRCHRWQCPGGAGRFSGCGAGR